MIYYGIQFEHSSPSSNVAFDSRIQLTVVQLGHHGVGAVTVGSVGRTMQDQPLA